MLTSFNRKITSNETKYLKIQMKLNSLITNDYNFFLGRMSECILQVMMDLKITLFINQHLIMKVLIMFLVGTQMDDIILSLSHFILLSYIA